MAQSTASNPDAGGTLVTGDSNTSMNVSNANKTFNSIQINIIFMVITTILNINHIIATASSVTFSHTTFQLLFPIANINFHKLLSICSMDPSPP